MSHTPGYWSVERAYGETGTYITCPSTAIVAKVWENKETEANARLIAAAPELLTALRAALAQLEYLKPERFDDDEHRAAWFTGLQPYRQAITKAEGSK